MKDGALRGGYVIVGQVGFRQVGKLLPFGGTGLAGIVKDVALAAALGYGGAAVGLGPWVAAGSWSEVFRNLLQAVAPTIAARAGVSGYATLRGVGNYVPMGSYTENAPDYARIGPMGDVIREPHVESFFSGGMGDGE